jgi:hypothetical protein
MHVDGVWKVEMLGPYGWENVSTAFLEKGHYRGASADHHSIGSYDQDGEEIRVQARLVQHGSIRTIFGENKKQLSLRIQGTYQEPNYILGFAYPAESRDYEVRVRLTRLEDLT